MKKTNKPVSSLTKTQKIEKLKRRMILACNAHIKSGGKIITGTFHKGKGCCPIYCVAGSMLRKDLESKLGFKLDYEIDLWKFIGGFDGTLSNQNHSLEFKLGQELRKKYITSEKK